MEGAIPANDRTPLGSKQGCSLKIVFEQGPYNRTAATTRRALDDQVIHIEVIQPAAGAVAKQADRNVELNAEAAVIVPDRVEKLLSVPPLPYHVSTTASPRACPVGQTQEVIVVWALGPPFSGV